MPGKHEIELFISKDGELKIHIKGIKGSGCTKIMESLTKEIGTESNRELTSEYYETDKTNNINQTNT